METKQLTNKNVISEEEITKVKLIILSYEGKLMDNNLREDFMNDIGKLFPNLTFSMRYHGEFILDIKKIIEKKDYVYSHTTKIYCSTFSVESYLSIEAIKIDESILN